MADISKLLHVLRAISDETRLRIVWLLCQGELTVSDMVQVLNISQPRISRHLRLLHEAMIIERIPEGSWVFYRLSAQDEITGWVQQIVSGCKPETDETISLDNLRLQHLRDDKASKANVFFARMAKDWEEQRGLFADDSVVEGKLLTMLGRKKFNKLVDLGTGTGRLLELLAPSAHEALGIDNNNNMLSIARSRISQAQINNAQARFGDICALGLAANSVDLVTLYQVLHFFDEPVMPFREACRICAHNGTICVVDFSPHTYELMRTKHAHKRLGISGVQIEQWCQANDVRLVNTIKIKGDAEKLEVSIWLIHKN